MISRILNLLLLALVILGASAGDTDNGTQIEGATDFTRIANVGDALKVSTALSSPNSRITYSASSNNVVLAALATDFFQIAGSATKTIRINYIEVTFFSATGVFTDVSLFKRSSANTGGTSASLTVVPHDSSSAAGSATALTYTANPTTGTLIGRVRAQKIDISNSTNAGIQQVIWHFGGDSGAQEIVLRGTAQCLTVNLGGVTVVGGQAAISIQWTEE